MPAPSGRFVELYKSETREHLDLLTRSILGLERGDAGAVEEAFRAAHTIKGLAAAMSHERAADLAHALEDRLSEVRTGAATSSADFVDELLRNADALDTSIREALAAGPQETDEGAPPARAAAAPPAKVATVSAPEGAAWEAVVRIAADAALPAARAELIRKATSSRDDVLGQWPAAGEPVENEIRLYLSDSADREAIEKLVRSCGEIDEVHFRAAGAPTLSRPAAAAAGGGTGSAVPRSIRVDRDRLDELAEGIAELSVLNARASSGQGTFEAGRAAAVLAGLQRAIMDMRMVPVSTAFERFPRVVRDAARIAGKEIDFELSGGDIELDQSVLDALVDPLVHLLRNAVDHGIESPDVREAAGKSRRGSLRVEAERERNSVRIRVSDDGAGVSKEKVARRGREMGLLPEDTDEPSEDDVFRLMFHPGFSTAAAVSELSGRGVGLDVVGARIRGLGGAIDLSTRPGEGTTFSLRVPVTLALQHALRIRLGDEEYGLPITHVSEVIPLGNGGFPVVDGAIQRRGNTLPLVELGRVLGTSGGPPSAAVIAVLGERRVALAVDRVLGHEQILVKQFDAPNGMLPVFSGATLLRDGKPALLIDPLSVL